MFFVQISYSRGEQYAAQVSAIFTETSALEATNVEELFVQISELCNDVVCNVQGFP